MASAVRPEASLLLYGGPSMHPLFRGGDLLDVAPCGPGGARPGDVIAFADSDGGPAVVHRVVAVAGAGLVTRGDNNGRRDDLPVCAELVLGRVAAIHRGANRIAVAGGRRGLLLARLLRRLRTCRRLAAPVVRGPYRALRRWLARAPAALGARPRVVTFVSGEISVKRLVVPGRVRSAR